MSDREQMRAHIGEVAEANLGRASELLDAARGYFEQADAQRELATTELELSRRYWREAGANCQIADATLRKAQRRAWVGLAFMLIALVVMGAHIVVYGW